MQGFGCRWRKHPMVACQPSPPPQLAKAYLACFMSLAVAASSGSERQHQQLLQLTQYSSREPPS